MASFLIDANLPRSTADVLSRHGQVHVDVRDLPGAPLNDQEISSLAIAQQFIILTGDGDFGDIRHYPPAKHFGIIVIRRPTPATTAQILHLIDTFMLQWSLYEPIAGKLIIVEQGYIRVRT